MSAVVHGIELYPGGAWFSDAGVQDLPGAPAGSPQVIQAVLGEGVAAQLGKDFGREELRTVVTDHLPLPPTISPFDLRWAKLGWEAAIWGALSQTARSFH